MPTRNSLYHLPEIKQAEINRISEIIKEVVDPEMIILFGSYAKGTYVEHRYRGGDGILYEYISDYDFLVVISKGTPDTTNQESLIMNRTDKFKPPVNLEIHGIDYINKGLEIGEYFFIDIVKEGIVLFDKGTVQFTEAHELTNVEKKEKAQRYYDTWFPQAGKFLKAARFSFSEEDYKIAVFLLHQSAESLYYAILLVFTDYKHKIHNLWKLRKKAKPYSEELFSVFRAETDKQEKHLFDLLKSGYIDARYRVDYIITEEELVTLDKRISKMELIVESICKEKIATFDKD